MKKPCYRIYQLLRRCPKRYYKVLGVRRWGEVLKKDGFKEVHTTQMLERSRRLQRSVKGKVWLVDEAGLLSGFSMLRLTELAEKQDARVILMGDSTQHESVERGNPFRMAGEWMKGSIKIASIDHIWRQQGDYKKVVESITKGDAQASLEDLQKLGWIHEKKTEIYRGVAEKYVEILKKGETVVATAPIHKEKHQVSMAIRQKLKEEKLLGKRESKLDILKPKNWTRAEREDGTRYEKGQVVKFVQNAKGGFTKSEKYEVLEIGDKNIKVKSFGKKETKIKDLPLNHADRFQVFEREGLKVSKGERILINANSRKDGLHNGQVLKVKKLDRKGIHFDNGTTVGKDFGHLTYAAGLKQWYVDVSRGNKSCQVFTDDLNELKQSIGRRQEEKAALEMRPVLEMKRRSTMKISM